MEYRSNKNDKRGGREDAANIPVSSTRGKGRRELYRIIVPAVEGNLFNDKDVEEAPGDLQAEPMAFVGA